MRTRIPLVLVAAAALTTLATPALAHTTANPSTTAAGAYAVVDMRVPHGCDGQATEVLDVQIPTGVTSVKPEAVPGWDVTTEIGEYDEPIEIHGEEITEGVVSVTWTAEEGEELADGHFRDFGLSVKFPDVEGETLYFPAVQTCVDGSEAAWIEIPSDEGEELESPSPAITLTAAEGGHGSHGGDDHDEEQGGEDGTAAEASADGGEATELTAVEAADEQSAGPMVWVALAVGLLGLAVGTAGFVAARRR